MPTLHTVAGHPPTSFLITLWVLTVLFLGGALAAIAWAGAQQLSGLRRSGAAAGGRRLQASCLLVAAVPTLLFGLFLLTWAIGVS